MGNNPFSKLKLLHINGNIGQSGKRALTASRPPGPGGEVRACGALDRDLTTFVLCTDTLRLGLFKGPTCS